jgi:hypothetical protein
MFPNTVAVIVFSLKEANLGRNLPAYPLNPRPGDMEDFAMRSWSEAAIIRQGPVLVLGAAFSIPGGLGVVEGNDIPYRPEALAKKKARRTG